MSITSFSFFFFVCAVLLLYFLVPRRFQWVVLLIASCACYLSYGAQYILYVLFTSVTVYSATVYMQGITDRQRAWLKGECKTLEKEEKNRIKAENRKRKKRAMLAALLANLLVLCACACSNTHTLPLSSSTPCCGFWACSRLRIASG